MGGQTRIIDLRRITALGIFGAGILTGFVLCGVSLAKSVKLVPGQVEVSVSNVDVITIVLAAVAVIVTALGVIVAIVAIWGFSSLRRQAHDVSKATAKSAVATSLEAGGDLHQLVIDTVIDITYRNTGIFESSGAADPEDEPESRSGGKG